MLDALERLRRLSDEEIFQKLKILNLHIFQNLKYPF